MKPSLARELAACHYILQFLAEYIVDFLEGKLLIRAPVSDLQPADVPPALSCFAGSAPPPPDLPSASRRSLFGNNRPAGGIRTE